jgi:hypothetical protein
MQQLLLLIAFCPFAFFWLLKELADFAKGLEEPDKGMWGETVA